MSNPEVPDKPTITPRDLSWHEALAGIDAREAAAASGGDAAQLRALVGAAAAEASTAAPRLTVGMPMLNDLPLRGDDLLVSMCLMLYVQVFGKDPCAVIVAAKDGGSIETLQAFAALALIFTQPDTAWDLLDHAADPDLSKEDVAGWKRAFRRAATDFAGTFGAAEIEIIGAHVIRLARRRSTSEEDAPGK